jgi:ubiquinone/menaquinone biosynthesis methyltransferase
MPSSNDLSLVPAVAERKAPLQGAHAGAVRSMFDRISPTYDLLNRLLSLGIDRAWRRKALDQLARGLPSDGPILDLCAGTLDLASAVEARFPGRRVLALDFAREMLVAGRAAGKVRAAGTQLAVADALRLPLAEDCLAGVVCGFGMRNLADPRAGVREVLRALGPGGVFVTLEFHKPTRLSTRAFHALYGDLVLPTVGSLVSRDRAAYPYLSRSMKGFLTRQEYEAALVDAGFADVEGTELLFGIASLVRACKPAVSRSAT